MEDKNNTNLYELSCSDASQSIDYHFLDNKEIEKLHYSNNLMKKFIEGVKDDLNFGPHNILSRYADRQIEVSQISKNVMNILDKRIQKMIKSKKLKKNWSGQDSEVLFWTFCHYSYLNGINSVEDATENDWENISNLIPGSNPDNCMFKILGLKKIRLLSRKWTQLENALLLQIVMKKKQKNWRVIAQQLYKGNKNPGRIFRNAKQCKQHWFCYLNPGLKKGSWCLEEDIKLLNYVTVNNGAKRWASIAKIFGGRTQNALKNRYTLIIGELKRQKNEQNQLKLIKQHLKKLEQKMQLKISIQNNQKNGNKIFGQNSQIQYCKKQKKDAEIIESRQSMEGKQKQEKNFGFLVFPIASNYQSGISMNIINNSPWGFQYFTMNGYCFHP